MKLFSFLFVFFLVCSVFSSCGSVAKVVIGNSLGVGGYLVLVLSVGIVYLVIKVMTKKDSNDDEQNKM
jgi:hypothetical protein